MSRVDHGPRGAGDGGPDRDGFDPLSHRYSLVIAIAAVVFFGAAAFSAFPNTGCDSIGLMCPSVAQEAGRARVEEPACEAPKDVSPGDADATTRTRAACRLALAARSVDQAQDDRTRAERDRLLEGYRWRRVQECVVAASECGARNCYSGYLAEFGASGVHKAEAQLLQERAEQKCRANALSTLADGRYLARSRGGCGAKPDSVTVEIQRGAISWRHDFQGISFNWSGTIDSDGVIEAAVGNSSEYRAAGRYNEADREVAMRYPRCESRISMQIINKIAN